MISYDYVVAWWPTRVNEAEQRLWIAEGKPIQKIFNDPVAASSYAMEQGWWPFIVERIERGD